MGRGVLFLCLLGGGLQATPLVMSHRAGMGDFPQASPAAIAHSLALGVDFIELDLRLSADEVPVVYHDAHIDPHLCVRRDGSTIPAALSVAALSLAEIKALRCGVRVNPRFPAQRAVPHHILTLREVLEIIAGHAAQVELMFELKRVSWRKLPTFVRAVLAVVADSGLSHRINLQSADLRIVGMLKKMSLWQEIALITDIVPAPASLLTPRRVAWLQFAGKRVVAYTVNSPQEWERLLRAGVDGFITDYPRTLQEFLARRP